MTMKDQDKVLKLVHQILCMGRVDIDGVELLIDESSGTPSLHLERENLGGNSVGIVTQHEGWPIPKAWSVTIKEVVYDAEAEMDDDFIEWKDKNQAAYEAKE